MSKKLTSFMNKMIIRNQTIFCWVQPIDRSKHIRLQCKSFKGSPTYINILLHNDLVLVTINLYLEITTW